MISSRSETPKVIRRDPRGSWKAPERIHGISILLGIVKFHTLFTGLNQLHKFQVAILVAVLLVLCAQMSECSMVEKALLKAGAAWGVVGMGAAVPFVVPIAVAQQLYQGGGNARFFRFVQRPVTATRQIAL